MKKIVLFFIFVLLYKIALSQVPLGFNYQAIARDGSGTLLVNQLLPVKIAIQTSITGGTLIWEEQHSVTTDQFGVMSFVIGKGLRVGGSALLFSDIDWNKETLYIKTSIQYPGPSYTEMGTTQLWAVPYSMVAKDLEGPVEKLGVNGTTDNMEEALFEVKNKNGQTVFAVYNEGVRIYVDDGDAKGAKGGFAIGGFGGTKTPAQNYFVVKPDTIRMYIDNTPGKAAKGGFAIGGFGGTKGTIQNYLVVKPDSVRIYIDDTAGKGSKGGFAIGGFGTAKGLSQHLFVVNQDSIRAYIDTNTGKGAKGGFAIGGFNALKATPEEYLRVTRDSIRAYINNIPAKSAKGGFAIGGFGNAKGFENEYLRVTSDSVKVSKSLLIPRLTMEERDNLPFTPGEALIIFNMTEGCMQIFKNGVWSNIWCFNCAPSFIIQPVDQTICSGENAVFFVSATGTNLNYKWQQSIDNGNTWDDISNGGSNPVVSGAKTYTLTLSNVPVAYNTYKYQCIVTGSCLPNIISNVVILNVGSTSHEITSQPVDQQLSNDCSVNFSISSAGYSVSYQWQTSSDGGNIWSIISNGGSGPIYAGVTTNTLNLSNVPKEFINYKYRCIVSNLCGVDVFSNPAVITTNAQPEITIQPLSQNIYTGQIVTFNIAVTGSGFNWQWQESANEGEVWSNIENGGTVPVYSGANTSTLSIRNVPLSKNNYKYRCIVSSYCHPDAISDAATLSVLTATTVTDFDGNTYNTVGIGSQLWMAENLRTTHYNEGTLIGTTTPATLDISNEEYPYYQWAYDGNESNVATYGRLYTGYIIASEYLCPTGWHVPTDNDWSTLENYLLSNGYNYDGTISTYNSNKLAKSLASSTGWDSSPFPGTPGNEDYPEKRNASGFSALPGGIRIESGFEGIGLYGNWGDSSGSMFTREISANYERVQRVLKRMYAGLSVRCIKDN